MSESRLSMRDPSGWFFLVGVVALILGLLTARSLPFADGDTRTQLALTLVGGGLFLLGHGLGNKPPRGNGR